MTVLSRLKVRTETDISDAELQLMIDEVEAEVVRRYGAIASIIVTLEGNRKYLSIHRRIDTDLTLTIVEIEPANTADAANETTLSADDYRTRYGGNIVERVVDGTNGRTEWAPLVRLTYTPVDDQKQRDEVTIKVVEMALTNGSLASKKTGDFSATYRDGIGEREKLMRRLAPQGRGLMA